MTIQSKNIKPVLKPLAGALLGVSHPNRLGFFTGDNTEALMEKLFDYLDWFTVAVIILAVLVFGPVCFRIFFGG